MTAPALLLRQAREDAGLSIRGLSERAGLSASTISRIESGRMHPTFDVLARALEAAGRRMELSAPAVTGPRLAQLVDAWRTSPRGDVVDWTRLRAFLDHLARHPEHADVALLQMPARSGSELLDNLLAGIAETISADAAMPPPAWTARVPALRTPWSMEGTLAMLERARETTPPALAARGITLTRSSLWREPRKAAR